MATYGYTGTTETVTISASGVYDLAAYGAEGGASGNGNLGGFGAAIGGDVYLAAGSQLELVVGGVGENGAPPAPVTAGYALPGYGGGGGGGGTFVFETYDGATHASVDTILDVAGGGGGGGDGAGLPASAAGHLAGYDGFAASGGTTVAAAFGPADAGGSPYAGAGDYTSPNGGISAAVFAGGAGGHAKFLGNTFAGGTGGHGGFGGGGGGGGGTYLFFSFGGGGAALGGGGGGGGGLAGFIAAGSGGLGGGSYYAMTSPDNDAPTLLFTDVTGGAGAVDGAHAGDGEVTLSLVTTPTDYMLGATSGPATPWSDTNTPGGKPWTLGAAPTSLQANDLVAAVGSSVLDSAATNFASDPTVGGHAAEVIGGLDLSSGAELTLEQDLDVTGAAGQPFGGAGSTITVGTGGVSAELYVQTAVPSAAGQVNVVHGIYDYAGHDNTETVSAQDGAFIDSGASNAASVTVESSGNYTDSGVQTSAAGANHDIVAVSGVAYEEGAYNADSLTVYSGGILTDTGSNDAGAVHLNGGAFHEDGSDATAIVDMTGGGTFYIDDGSFAGSIANFGPNGAISIPNSFVYLGFSAGVGGDHLVFLDTTTLTADLIPISLAAGVTPDEVIQEPSGLIEVVVCFASGSRIRTAKGEVAVEDLAVGDLALTASGEARPIVWLGYRRIVRPTMEQGPVRVMADAFGEGLPACDLLLSPGHAVCVDVVGEVFVPIDHLINGVSIFREKVPEVTYWHVELESHDLLLAEGLPCESYMDAGNRAFFGRAHGRLGEIDPDRVAESLAHYARPFVDSGPIVEAIRERLAARAVRYEPAVEDVAICVSI